MLGILLWILKCIGIILLSLFLLTVFLMAVVLLCPVRYRMEGEYKGEIRGNFFVDWLLGIFRIYGNFSPEGEPDLTVKVLWFTLVGKEKKRKKKRKRKKKKRSVPQRMPQAGGVQVAREKTTEPATAGEVLHIEEKPLAKKPSPLPPLPEEPTAPPASPKGIRRVKLSDIEEKPLPEDFAEGQAFFTGEPVAAEESSRWMEIKGYWEKFQAVEDKKQILSALKRLVKRLIGGILPKGFWIKGTVGLGEPELTGCLMALMGVLTAKLGNNVQVKADFTRLTAEDIEIRVKGRMVVGYFLYATLAFLLTKPVRKQAIKLWKGRSKNG